MLAIGYSYMVYFIGVRCKRANLACYLKYFDLVKGVTPEYMHLALLGVSKLVLTMWMSDARSHGSFSNLHVNMSVVEERIKQIEVPSEITCKPRGISKLKHWKGAYGTYNFIM